MSFTVEGLYLISLSLVILMKIVCFILSYKIIKLGHNLISAGVKGEFKFSSNFIGFKADLVSLSPGLLFLLLGVMLMGIAVYTNKNVSLQKNNKSTPVVADTSEAPFPDSNVTLPEPSQFHFKDSLITK